jgi:hypothetical protein
MENILNNINQNFPLWNDLDDETKLCNYIEFVLYLVKPRKWNIRISNSILLDKDKFDKIQNIASELNRGINIWHRLSLGTIKSYINLPKTIKKTEKEIKEQDDEGNEFVRKNKLDGKDLLNNLFNIHHLRIDGTKSNTKFPLFGEDIHFVEQKQNDLLFAMFDDRFSTVYFLDILKHDDLYKYSKILSIIINENLPRPFQSFNLSPVLKNGFSDEEFKKLLFSAVMMTFNVGDSSFIPLNQMTTSGFTDKIIKICDQVKRNEVDIVLPSDFIYIGQIFSEFYQFNFKL